MICPECGGKIEKNICVECGYEIKKQHNTNNEKKQKKISKTFLIIGIFIAAVIILCIVMSVVINIIDKNNKDKIVSSYCDNQKYIEDSMITDVLNNYKCDTFVSYMIDTNGDELTENHLKFFLELKDKKVYKMIKEFTNKELYELYKDIEVVEYYEYLKEANSFGVIPENEYTEMMSRSIDDNNIELFKTLLEGNQTLEKKYKWEGADYYIGGNSAYKEINSYNYAAIKRTLNEKIEFAKEYFKYNNEDRVINFFDEELAKKTLSKEKLDDGLFVSFAKHIEFMTYSELENYVKWGGYFYKEDKYSDIYYDAFFKNYIYKAGSNIDDKDYLKKVRLIIRTAKQNGYDIAYADELDAFLRSHSLTMQHNKKNNIKQVYDVMVSEGYKCFSECSSVKFFK